MSKLYAGTKLIINTDDVLVKEYITRAEYDALETKDENKLYIITDESNPLEDVAYHSDLPTKVSQLTNDAGYITSKEELNLDKVDNTSDLDKPISTATAAALDGKVDESEYNTTINTINTTASTTSSTLTSHINNKSNPHAVTKTQVGLGNVTNDALVKRSEMGVASGVATLDTSGKVPASQLPSYVDDVLEYTSTANFPATGESGKIYVATNTNLTYRWSGNSYVEISPSLALGETSSTAYSGDKGAALATKVTLVEGKIPTKTSQLTNDSNFLTSHLSLEGYVTTNTANNTYVKKAGDTMTGLLTINPTTSGAGYNEGIRINKASSGWTTLYMGDVANSTSGAGNNGWGIHVNPSALCLIARNSSPALGIALNGTGANDFKWLGNTVWHAGNDGVGSGLDADLLDGYQSLFYGALGIKGTFLFASQSSVASYIKIGTLTTPTVTSNGSAYVDFEVTGMVNFGNNTGLKLLVFASTRGAAHVEYVEFGNGFQARPCYRTTSTGVEIWVRHTNTYSGLTSVEVTRAVNFTPAMTITTTNPGDLVDGVVASALLIASSASIADSANEALYSDEAAHADEADNATYASSAGSATSATKLTTSRTLWGQSFNGTANVTGSISNTGNVTPMSNNVYSIGSTTSKYANMYNNYTYTNYVYTQDTTTLRLGSNKTTSLAITSEGNVGIGTTTPSSKLSVHGKIVAADAEGCCFVLYRPETGLTSVLSAYKNSMSSSTEPDKQWVIYHGDGTDGNPRGLSWWSYGSKTLHCMTLSSHTATGPTFTVNGLLVGNFINSSQNITAGGYIKASSYIQGSDFVNTSNVSFNNIVTRLKIVEQRLGISN